MNGQPRHRQPSPTQQLTSRGPGKIKRGLRIENPGLAAVARLLRQPEAHAAGSELTIIHEKGSSCDTEPATCEDKDELLATGASLMNDVLGIGLHAPLTSRRMKTGAFEAVAIDFYIHAFAPSWTTPLVTMTATLDSPNPCLATFLPTAMQNEELFHAIVALSLSSIESLSPVQAGGGTLKQPSANMLYHRFWALKFLREKLTPPKNGVDDAMLLTAIILIAGQLGDVKSFDAHCRGLRQMIQTRGSLEGFGIGALLKRFFEQNDYDWALETGQDLARIFPKNSPDVPLATVPLAFTKLMLSAHSHSQLLDIISRMSYWIESVGRVWQGIALQPHRDLLLSYTPFQEVAELLECLEYASALEEQSFEAALCLALILIANNFYGDARGRYLSWYQTLRKRLTATLLHHIENPVEDPGQRHCFIWIAMVAVESWRTGHFLLPAGRQLMQEVWARYEEAQEWPTLQDVLKRFLWYDPLGTLMETCWQERAQASVRRDMTVGRVRPTAQQRR